MDPITVLKSLIKLAIMIHEHVQQMNANKAKGERLIERIDQILSSIQGLTEFPRHERFIQTLKTLERFLKEISEFLESFCQASWFNQVIQGGTYTEKFDDFNQRIAELLPQLGIGLSAQILIDREQDRQDEEKDRALMQGKLDKILQQEEKILRAVQKKQLSADDLETIIQKQMQSMMLQMENRLKISMDTPSKSSSILPAHFTVQFYDIVFADKVGQSHLGAIFRGHWKEQPVMVKFIEGVCHENDRQQFIREIQILSQLHNEYIVPFYGACIEMNRLCYLMGVMENGDLESYFTHLDYKKRLRLVQELARGLHYLHEQGVIHGDIKPKNVWIDEFQRGKWTDFGLSKTREQSLFSSLTSSHEVRWQAPESWQRRAQLSTASDIYSFGMLMWMLMMDQLPYASWGDDATIMKRVQAGDREILPTDMPTECIELMTACWAPDPAKRPKSIELVRVLNVIKYDAEAERASSPTGDVLYEQANVALKAKKSAEAYPLFARAAQKGCFKAKTTLGLFALQGLANQQVNKKLGVALLEEAAEKGHARADLTPKKRTLR